MFNACQKCSFECMDPYQMWMCAWSDDRPAVLGVSPVLGGASVVLYMAVSERSDRTELMRN